MPTKARGITMLLSDPAKTTPFKQAKITGMSFSVELRTLDVMIARYSPNRREFVPLANFPIVLRLLNSNQNEPLVSDVAGFIKVGFPDANIEVQLSPAAVPAGHKAVLNYSIKTQKRNALTVIFIPDSMRRYYPVLQLL